MLERIKQFFYEVKVEFKKVVFPSKDELVGSTWVVIITTVIVSFYLGAIDLGLSKLIAALLR
jgi:preprotein translocase subunit SecE